MAEQQQAAPEAEQSEQVAAILGEIAERSRKLVEDFVARQSDLDGVGDQFDGHAPMGGAFVEMLSRVMSQPHELAQAQFGLWQDYVRLWQHTTQRMLGVEVEPVIVPDRGDRRFKDAAWNDNALFDFIKQSYLLTSKYFLRGRQAEGRPERQDAAEARVLHPPVRRDDGAVELRRHQSRGAAPDARDPRREPAARPQEHAGGPRSRQGQARDPDDRPGRVRGRPQHRHHPGQGRVPDRAHAADPVRAARPSRCTGGR